MDHFDVHAHKNKAKKVTEAFVAALKGFLQSITGGNAQCDKIARLVAENMSSPDLHYHTVVHVQTMLDVAKELSIELADYEQLAIYFHDVIYVAGSSNNEVKSIKFMRLYLDEIVDLELLQKASAIIEDTAFHHVSELLPQSHTVLDLDLYTLASNKANYDCITECIRQEFPFASDEQFQLGRKKFFTLLTEKGFLFRTEPFKHLENKAMSNIQAEIGTSCD